MADFDVIYPANKKLTFDGGKNSKFQVQLLPDNESPDCLNVSFEDGAVETRNGSIILNTASVGSFAGAGLYTRHSRTGAESMCAWFNGTLFVISGTSFSSIPSSTSIFTANTRVGATEYENYIFFGNGGTIPYKYADNDFTRHGIYPPTTTAAVASTAMGALTGDYRYKVTFVNSALVESDVGPVTTTFTAAIAQLTLTSIPTAAASFGVLRRKIYRTEAGGSTFKLLTTLNDNTDTDFVDTVADASLGAEPPTDQGVPPNWSFALTHMGRVFVNDTANPQLVWYSEIDNPYVFKTTSFIRVGDDSGDLVRGFDIHDNGLVVKTDVGNYMIYMATTTPSDWSLVKLRSSFGSKSPFGSFTYNNKVMFPAIQNSKLAGFAALSGDGTEPEATLLTVSASGSDLKSDRIEPDVFEIQSTAYDRISSIVYKNKAYISVTYGSGATNNNRVYSFDFSMSNLTKQQKASWVPWTGINAEQFTIYGGSLYYISSTANGFVYRLERESVYLDETSAINSYYWTKEFSGRPGDEQFVKDWRYVYLLFEKSGDYFMNITYRVDSDRGEGNTITLDLNPGGSLWGQMILGVDNWGGGNNQGEEKINLGQLRGKRIQFKFSNQNTTNQKFKVIGMQLAYNKKGKR